MSTKRLVDWLIARKSIVLIVFVYPMLYNLAGYYIAWQFESVRLFYTDTTDIKPFGAMLIENFRSGLYFFQIPRALIWVLLALPVYYSVEGNYVRKGVIIGLLFATLMNAQHEDVLTALSQGKLDDSITSVLATEAENLAKKY